MLRPQERTPGFQKPQLSEGVGIPQPHLRRCGAPPVARPVLTRKILLTYVVGVRNSGPFETPYCSRVESFILCDSLLFKCVNSDPLYVGWTSVNIGRSIAVHQLWLFIAVAGHTPNSKLQSSFCPLPFDVGLDSHGIIRVAAIVAGVPIISLLCVLTMIDLIIVMMTTLAKCPRCHRFFPGSRAEGMQHSMSSAGMACLAGAVTRM